MPNKKITVIFELNAAGYIVQIHAPGLPADYVKSLINCAHADLEDIIKPDAPKGYTHILPPGDKIMQDVNYILNGGYIENLPDEN